MQLSRQKEKKIINLNGSEGRNKDGGDFLSDHNK